ncbi:MAG: hypothetical protein ACKN9I_01480, partial [Alphaproteobacteria bacterium]
MSLNSCSDSGCIEADDFGEYDIFRTNVYSNSLDGLCNYNTKLTCSSLLHPLLLKGCIEERSCCDKPNSSDQTTCLKTCETDCKNDPSKLNSFAQKAGYIFPNSSNKSEPNWLSVGSLDFKIFENTKILITATGNIDIGEKGGEQLSLDKNSLLDSEKENNKHLKVSANDQIELTLSADFGIDIERAPQTTYQSYFTNPTYSSSIDILKNNELKTKHPEIANGSKRIFAYFIPTPSIPEITDQSLAPIFANPKTSNCVLKKENNRYYKAECSADDNTFPDKYNTSFTNDQNKSVSSAFQMNNKGDKNTKYNDSGFLLGSEEKPLSSNTPIPSSEDNKNYIKDINNNLILNISSTRISPPNIYKDYDVRIVLTPKDSDSNSCEEYYKNPNSKPQYHILKDGEQAPEEYSLTIDIETDLTVIDNFSKNLPKKFAYKTITLKPKQSLLIKKMSSGDDTKNEACSFELHFYPYYSVSNTKSGLVKMGQIEYYRIEINNEFSEVHATSNQFASLSNCNMNYNIKNADGSYEFNDHQTYTFNNNSNDNSGIFIRNGQELLIKPNIWDKFYTLSHTSGIFQINCGVAFFIEKKPKPAVICHKQKTEKVTVNEDYIDTNDCKNLLITDNVVQGCSFDYNNCDEYQNIQGQKNNNFCPRDCLPSEEDIKLTTCKSSYNGVSYTQATGCPDFSSISNFQSQTTTGSNPLAFLPTYNKINIKCADSCPLDSSGICKNFNTFYTDFRYKSTYDGLPASEKSSFVTFEKCKSCMVQGINKLKTSFASIDSTSLDLCYDLENYTGSLFNFYNTESSTVDRMKVLELKNKGLEYLKPFVNGYGNFYPLKYTDETNHSFTQRNKYKSTNNAFFTSNGFLKFTLITNAIDLPSKNNLENYNTQFINKIFYNDNSNKDFIRDSSKLSVSSTSSSKFSNGQRLSIVPCYDEGSAKCDGGGNEEDLISTNPLGADNIPKIISYTNDGSPNSLNNYSFNELGNLYRTTNASLNPLIGQCSGVNQPFEGANFLCLNNRGSDLKANRLSFKIIDSEKPNCKKSNGEDCSSGNDCDGTKTINIKWDGKTTGNCIDSTQNCNKKFICTERYFNNTGKYTVTIRVINPEKAKIANLVNSIISPLMEEIDGYKLDKDDNLDLANGNFMSTIYPIYPLGNPSGSSTIKLDENFLTGQSPFGSHLIGENIAGYYKTSFNYNSSSKNFNVTIPSKTDGNCSNGSCVIAYMVAFVGDIDPLNGKVVITSNNCFSAGSSL